jgi:hypothetical protein
LETTFLYLQLGRFTHHGEIKDGNEEKSSEEEEEDRSQKEEVVTNARRKPKNKRGFFEDALRKKAANRCLFFIVPTGASSLRQPLTFAYEKTKDRLAQLRVGFARTPPGPRGSNGSDCFRVRN